MTTHLKRFLSNHRRNKVVRWFDKYLVELHEAYENMNYDLHESREKFVLHAIQRNIPTQTVFDIGENIGDWTKIVSENLEGSRICSFEIVGDTYRQLAENCGEIKNVFLNNAGLSDQPGEIDIYCSPQATQLATFVNGVTEKYHGLKTDRLRLPVPTDDRYCADNGIREIDFLMIDVEGMEDRVLKGFSRLLA